MEENKKTIRFNVIAGDKEALEKAIREINSSSQADYELIKHESHEVGIATIEVSENNIKPEFLFLMGVRYMHLCKKIDIKF